MQGRPQSGDAGGATDPWTMDVVIGFPATDASFGDAEYITDVIGGILVINQPEYTLLHVFADESIVDHWVWQIPEGNREKKKTPTRSTYLKSAVNHYASQLEGIVSGI